MSNLKTPDKTLIIRISKQLDDALIFFSGTLLYISQSRDLPRFSKKRGNLSAPVPIWFKFPLFLAVNTLALCVQACVYVCTCVGVFAVHLCRRIWACDMCLSVCTTCVGVCAPVQGCVYVCSCMYICNLSVCGTHLSGPSVIEREGPPITHVHQGGVIQDFWRFSKLDTLLPIRFNLMRQIWLRTRSVRTAQF